MSFEALEFKLCEICQFCCILKFSGRRNLQTVNGNSLWVYLTSLLHSLVNGLTFYLAESTNSLHIARITVVSSNVIVSNYRKQAYP